MTLFELKQEIKKAENALNMVQVGYAMAEADAADFASKVDAINRDELVQIARERDLRVEDKKPSKNNTKTQLVNVIQASIAVRVQETKALYEQALSKLESLKLEYEQAFQAEQERTYEEESSQEPQKSKEENSQEPAAQEHQEWVKIESLAARPIPGEYWIHFLENSDIDIFDADGKEAYDEGDGENGKPLATKSTHAAAMRFIGTHAGRVQLPQNYKLRRFQDNRWYLTQLNEQTGEFEKVLSGRKETGHSRFSRAHTAAVAFINKKEQK